MSQSETIEERVAVLEAKVSDLQRRLESAPTNGDWHNPMATIRDIDLLEKAMQYAREFEDAELEPVEDPVREIST